VKLEKISCETCGGQLEINDIKTAAKCVACGNVYFIKDEASCGANITALLIRARLSIEDMDFFAAAKVCEKIEALNDEFPGLWFCLLLIEAKVSSLEELYHIERDYTDSENYTKALYYSSLAEKHEYVEELERLKNERTAKLKAFVKYNNDLARNALADSEVIAALSEKAYLQKRNDDIYLHDKTEYLHCGPKEFYRLNRLKFEQNKHSGLYKDFVLDNQTLKKCCLIRDAKKVDIPFGIVGIEESAFRGLGYESITIPGSVTSIGPFAFSDCKNLGSLAIPHGVTSIPKAAFRSCVNLESITIPNSITNIGPFAFEGCKNLSSIKLPTGVTSIAGLAFSLCTRISSLKIPDNVTFVGEGAFLQWTIDQTIFVNKDVESKWHPAWNYACYAKVVYRITESELDTPLEDITDHAELMNIIRTAKFSDRLAAVEKITDQAVLAEIAISNDHMTEICKLAAKRVSGQPMLAVVARKAKDNSIRLAAAEKVTDQAVLAEIVKTDNNSNICKKVFEKIDDPALLADIAKTTRIDFLRLAATEKITDQAVLAEIAVKDRSLTAVKKITDQALLASVAKTNPPFGYDAICKAALERITDQAALADVARTAEVDAIRRAAIIKVADQEVIIDVVRNDKDFFVRMDALKLVKDQAVLADFAREAEDISIRMAARKRVTDQVVLAEIAVKFTDRSAFERITDQAALVDVARKTTDKYIRKAATEKITDQAVLAEIAVKYTSLTAVKKITDQALLASVAKSCNNDSISKAALEQITDQAALADVAREAEKSSMRQKAILKVTDQEVIVDVAKNDKDFFVRKAALQRIADKTVLDK